MPPGAKPASPAAQQTTQPQRRSCAVSTPAAWDPPDEIARLTLQGQTPRMAQIALDSRGDPVGGRGSLPLSVMARLSHILSVVSLVLGILLVLATLALSEGGFGATGLLIGGVLILNGVIRLWLRTR